MEVTFTIDLAASSIKRLRNTHCWNSKRLSEMPRYVLALWVGTYSQIYNKGVIHFFKTRRKCNADKCALTCMDMSALWSAISCSFAYYF